MFDRAVGRRLAGAGATLGIALMVGIGMWVVRRELASFPPRAVREAIATISDSQLALALLLTAASFAALQWYDRLALRYLGRPLPARRTALASFVAFAFSQSVGVSAIAGGSVRYRFWSAWGLRPGEIAKGVLFIGVTLWLGAVTLAGVATITRSGVSAPFPIAPAAGFLLLLPAIAYVGWAASGRAATVRGRRVLHPPPLRLALGQVAIAVTDWLLAALVFIVLLPRDSGIGLPGLLTCFVAAQLAGIVSHVPGGIGVFDAVVLVSLSPFTPVTRVAAALVAYRVTYYLIPLGSALVVLLAYEVTHRRRMLMQAGRAVGRVISAGTPLWLAAITFIAGVVLLASGATPAVGSRLRWLDAVVPLGLIELSHFAASIVGVVLLFVANGLRRRLDAAWHATVALLAVGIAACLLKGWDYEEALTLGVVLAIVVPARGHFYRRAALIAEPLSRAWIIACALAVAASTWLGFFSYQHVVYRASLWWRFALTADAPRFLRATVGVAVVLIAYAVARLLKPAAARVLPPSAGEVARAREIVRRASSSGASIALAGDKAMLFSESGAGMLMYGVHRRVWVAVGDPVGPLDASRELVQRFCDLAHRHAGWPAFYEITPALLPICVDMGLSLVKIGEEARVSLEGWDAGAPKRKWQRRALRDGERAGLTFEVVYPPFAPALMADLEAVSSEWLTTRGVREKGFSLGSFNPEYLANFPLALVRREAMLVAFANLWRSGAREELSVDLMRYGATAPHGVMDFLFLRLMSWGHEQGFGSFNLGMAPFSGFALGSSAPLWNRLGGLVYRHGEHFYHFRGLRQYKEKYDPEWSPRYLAAPATWTIPIVLLGVTALVSRGLRGAVAQ